jgi:hypothetical protein
VNPFDASLFATQIASADSYLDFSPRKL